MKSRSSRAVVVTLIPVLLGQLAGSRGVLGEFPSGNPAPATALPPEIVEVEAAWQLRSSRGDRVWTDWGASSIPLLIRFGEFDFLIGHPSPPPQFKSVPEAVVAGQRVYRASGHLVPIPAATAWKVADVWSVATPTRQEFQKAVDAQLGKGVVQIDAVNYIRVLVHESFHAFHLSATKGDVPRFGSDFNEREMIQTLSAQPDLGEQHAAEGRALVSALRSNEKQRTLEAAAEFLKLRKSRRSQQNDERVAAFEKTTEWLEGLARYAEVALLLEARQAEPPVTEKTLNYPTRAETWQSFLNQVADPAASPDGFRGRYYLLGAAQAFLLDRLAPDWRAGLFKEKVALEDLLNRAAH